MDCDRKTEICRGASIECDGSEVVGPLATVVIGYTWFYTPQVPTIVDF